VCGIESYHFIEFILIRKLPLLSLHAVFAGAFQLSHNLLPLIPAASALSHEGISTPSFAIWSSFSLSGSKIAAAKTNRTAGLLFFNEVVAGPSADLFS
jgi:hypothetical protein